jgi:hypothetical protein
MQLGNFVPNPIGQTIGKIGNIAGVGLDAYQTYDALSEGNYTDAAINAGSVFLPMGLDSKTFRRNSKYLQPGQPLYPFSPQANLPANASMSMRINAPQVNYIEPFTKVKGMTDTSLLANRALLGTLGAETVYDIPKQKNGGWLDNYNDSQSSAPEGMIGDGFSNVGRNYSPAWGGSFQEGGEIPMAQKGKKVKPLYVESKNDPRYLAYQDSLSLYNQSVDLKEKLKPYFNTDAIKSKDKVLDILDDSQVYRNYDKTKNKPVISPINVSWSTGKPLLVNAPGRMANNSNMSMASYPIYTKPQQQVIIKPKQVNPKEKLVPLQPISVGLQNVDNEFETNLNIPNPAQRQPKYYNVRDINNQRFGGTDTQYRVESLDELRELPKELWDRKITPQYQIGGSIPGAVGFSYARTQGTPSEGPYAKKTMPSAQNGVTWQLQQSKVKAEKYAKLKKLLEQEAPVYKKKSIDEQLVEKKQEKNLRTISKDNTVTRNYNNADKFLQSARNKTDKEIAKERQARIDAQTQANAQPFDWSNFRQSLADRSQATGDALRISNEPNFFDDYINPASMIGSMADNLGQAPLSAQQEDSFMPYVTAIGTPLAVGAMAGLGTQNTGQFVNNLANPLAGTGTVFKYAAKKIKNDVGLMKDLIFDKNTTLNKNFVFDSKNKIYNQIEDGYKTLDNSLERKIKELNTEEGYKRLVNQEKEYLQDFYYDPKNVDLKKAAIENADARIEELENIKAFGNKNKEFSYNVDKNKVDKVGIFKPNIETVQYRYDIPTNNAHYQYADGIVDNPSGSKMLPGKITLGRGYENSVPTAEHEINHALQRGRTLKIDNDLKKIIPDYKKNLSYDDINAYTYFKSGSNGQEPSAFLAELRSQMKQDGFIKNTYDEITPDLIEKAKNYYGKNKTKKVFLTDNGLQGITKTRILDFLRATPENYKIISDAMNKLPVIAPLAGATYLATQEEELPKKQQGGVIKDNNGYWNPDNWGNPVEIDSNQITMKGVNQPLLGISDTGDTQMMYPEKEYEFDGKKVTEFPLAKDGKELVKLNQLTNFTNYNKPTVGGWLNKYN